MRAGEGVDVEDVNGALGEGGEEGKESWRGGLEGDDGVGCGGVENGKFRVGGGGGRRRRGFVSSFGSPFSH